MCAGPRPQRPRARGRGRGDGGRRIRGGRGCRWWLYDDHVRGSSAVEDAGLGSGGVLLDWR
ncbi:Protein of unknown function, partial [Gryllus bimaculatus]